VNSLHLNSTAIVFTKTLVYLIQREIDLTDHPENNFKSLVQDGLFGPGLGIESKSTASIRPKEHLMMIKIDLQLPVGGSRITDSFSWDITNPDNSADDFAQVML
jgi:hypothetical protein